MLKSLRAWSGLRTFLVVWLGQLFSLLGSSMTVFAITIWAFEKTGKATSVTMILVSYSVAQLIMFPLAGVIVDRFDRKNMMIISDLASGVVTASVMVLYLLGLLEIWHMMVGGAVMGAFQSMQWPAYSAVISVMVPKEHYTRANGLVQIAGPSAQIIAPLLAGALLGVAGLAGVMAADLLTLTFAVLTLLFVTVPKTPRSEISTDTPASVIAEMAFGFRYIFQRLPLLSVQTLFLVGNFLFTMSFNLLAPMILLRTGNDEMILASLQTLGAVGGLAGAIGVSVWGGFNRRINGVLIGWIFALTFSGLLASNQGYLIWAMGLFAANFFAPLIDSSNQSIWQAKVHPAHQGRVFSIRMMIAMLVTPIASAITGPLADNVLEPAMTSGGWLPQTFGGIVGTEPGSGMALMFMFSAACGIILGLVGYSIRAIRDIETILPDHDAKSIESTSSEAALSAAS